MKSNMGRSGFLGTSLDHTKQDCRAVPARNAAVDDQAGTYAAVPHRFHVSLLPIRLYEATESGPQPRKRRLTRQNRPHTPRTRPTTSCKATQSALQSPKPRLTRHNPAQRTSHPPETQVPGTSNGAPGTSARNYTRTRYFALITSACPCGSWSTRNRSDQRKRPSRATEQLPRTSQA